MKAQDSYRNRALRYAKQWWGALFENPLHEDVKVHRGRVMKMNLEQVYAEGWYHCELFHAALRREREGKVWIKNKKPPFIEEGIE